MVIGILAHVDAGKTTLSEAILYESASIRKMGRVDNGDTFLDTDGLEKERGITIFSKQAHFSWEERKFTLLDTPGHMDFSAEMERTLQVLDCCILVVSGADGVQAHTRTLWQLLKRYGLPVFIFVNKMDQPGTDKAAILKELQEKLSEGCVDFSDTESEGFKEAVAVSDEAVLEEFLKSGTVAHEKVVKLIAERKIFPCFFGSALKLFGVKEFLDGFIKYTKEPVYGEEFAGRVFKIARDAQGNRLTYLKVTGGSLKVRSILDGEKINQLRLYSGEKFETVQEVRAGEVCALTGLEHTYPGQGVGAETLPELPVLEPVLTYRVDLPEDVDAAVMLPKLRILEEEDPQLHLVWEEATQEIQVRIMGEVQLEILKELVKRRFHVDIAFSQGTVVYKETIKSPAVGVGHFEPLRHYAEVQLLLEPGETGSGLSLATDCGEDILAKNWQRLVLTHLEEKEHKGVLLGAPVTDMKITLLSGRAHLKHTEGGDFRQATYRAVRQGLMEAESVLLEPYYDFILEVPEAFIGRAMTDIERKCGNFTMPELNGGRAVLRGNAPVSTLWEYQKEVLAYTKGEGSLSCTLKGYLPCHNTEEILEKSSYNPEEDLKNPTGSVFCAHGAGFVVPWDEVKAYAHTELAKENTEDMPVTPRRVKTESSELSLGTEEIDAILKQTYGANKREENIPRKGIYKRREKTMPIEPVVRRYQPVKSKEEYLLVDGYNVVFAWDELKDIATVSIDGARGRLLDILCDYQAIRGCHLIVVFDAYRVKGHTTETFDYHNIQVVFTKEAETADCFIEKFAHENAKNYRVTVATSDGLEQIIIRGEGCALLSARELLEEIRLAKENLRENYHL